MFQKPFKHILAFTILLISPILIYSLVAYILTFYPQDKRLSTKKCKDIYILYDKMHTDILINIDDLNEPLHSYLTDSIQNRKGYLAFGWGDKETYLNTPTWSDISILTTLKALFINTPSLLHVIYYKDIEWFKHLKRVKVSLEQEELLMQSILNSFNKKENPLQGYSKNDLFYPSLYRYNLFYTCNTWTGERLRDANISVAYWTPFSYNVVASLPQNE